MTSSRSRLKSKIDGLISKYYRISFAKKEFIPGETPVPASGKVFDEKELCSAVDAVLDCWWTEGRITKQFEKKFNRFLGIKHTLVVNSGSSANLIALAVLTSPKLKEKKLSSADEVITIAAGFPTTINPIIQYGCIPVFCDINLETYSINTEQLKKAISPNTKAIFIAHTLGNPFNISKVKDFCRKYNLWLIEDCCDALGSKYRSQRVGIFGDLSTFSFYPAHHITMGEGGAVCTNNELLYKIARSFRDWGRDCWCGTGKDNTCGKRFSWQCGELPKGYDHKYIYSEIGYNLKNTDLNVSIGLAQLNKLQKVIEIRRRNFKLLYEGLSKFKDYFYLPRAEPYSAPSWFAFMITLKENCNFIRDDLIKFLNDNKIGTRLLFSGNVTKQPYFIDNKIKYRMISNLHNTNLVLNNGFWIGVYPGLTEEAVHYIIEKFGLFFRGRYF
jgi:CDP-6-deoxy-D-xylo-4-hexulose-3-dehydrase